jgi:hypothetical protein
MRCPSRPAICAGTPNRSGEEANGGAVADHAREPGRADKGT